MRAGMPYSLRVSELRSSGSRRTNLIADRRNKGAIERITILCTVNMQATQLPVRLIEFVDGPGLGM